MSPGAETRGTLLAPGGCDSAPPMQGKSWLVTTKITRFWVSLEAENEPANCIFTSLEKGMTITSDNEFQELFEGKICRKPCCLVVAMVSCRFFPWTNPLIGQFTKQTWASTHKFEHDNNGHAGGVSWFAFYVPGPFSKYHENSLRGGLAATHHVFWCQLDISEDVLD